MINYRYMTERNINNPNAPKNKIVSPIYFTASSDNMYREEWREITPDIVPDIREHSYYISSHGRVFSTLQSNRYNNLPIVKNSNSNFIEGKLLKHHKNFKGYHEAYFFTREGSPQRKLTRKVHRMVLMMFRYVPGCEQLEVDHIDNDINNNYLYNLQWVTREENYRRRLVRLNNIEYPIEEGIFLQENDFFDIFEKFYSCGFTIDEISLSYNLSVNYIYSLISGDIRPELRNMFFSLYPDFYTRMEDNNLDNNEILKVVTTNIIV